MFLKISALFVIGFLIYLFSIVFFLYPKINNYLNEIEIQNSQIQFTKISSIINNESNILDGKDKVLNKIQSLLNNSHLEQTKGINSLLINISILLFTILSLIAIFITIKIILPLDKILLKIHKVNIVKDVVESKDEIASLSLQFDLLINEIENNKKTLDENVNQRTKEIQNRLYIDELTNLKNRTALEDDIKDEDFVTISLVDIDSFDDINELYGFPTGNLVLIEVAKILNKFAIKYNVNVYRFYGNVYCLAEKDLMGFSKFDEFIRELSTLFKNEPIHIEELSLDIFINITLGISIAQEESIKTAGIALKKAKKANLKYIAYNNEIDTKEVIKKSMYWREKIKEVIDGNKVTPFYQPIFNRNNEIVKYETLMRLKDENDDGAIIYLSPYLFLDISVKTKQYLQLSDQVISKAFTDLLKTKKQLSLNLSFKDITDLDFLTSLDKNLEKLDKDKKQQLVFEILESDYISDYTLLEEFIIKYRDQGIQIAIDDFGTGYSNFAHILKIRPNYIKIDGSLIKNINTEKSSYELVKSIIDFSKALNIKVIAEFVHSAEVYKTVLDLGVDEFQGFYLGEPANKIE